MEEQVEDPTDSNSQALIIINQMELDKPSQLKALERLLQGLETMLPRMIICIGRFFSDAVNETESYSSFQGYFEALGAIVKDNKLVHLRDTTEWVFVPNMEDPGQMKLMPGL